MIAVTIGLGYASTGLKSEFSIKDILPRGGSVLEDMNTLEAAGRRLNGSCHHTGEGRIDGEPDALESP